MKQSFKRLLTYLMLFMLTALFTACQVQTPVRTVAQTTAGLSQTGIITQAPPGIRPQTTTPVTKPATKPETKPAEGLAAVKVTLNSRYTSKLEVAAYLYQFKKLPPNFITKQAAQAAGWVASRGNLWEVTDRMSIGGDKFGNFEKLLPVKKGRQYYEADIDYRGGPRGAKRIVYSNDGLIYYSGDHYSTFEKLN